ncbi:MAG TPA: endolytic transglycosylase MltG [Candidatus Nitrosocosmicus sp.]|nr:endolytic transglycosylase MltG [Candidatus Nitrosocosmicus sp.]
MKKLLTLFIFLIIIFGSLFLYYQEGSLPVNKKAKDTAIFVIRPGEAVPEIAKNLENENLIRNKVVFYWTVKRLGIDNKIQAGDFRLSQSMSAEEIAKNLTQGTLDEWVTIIEGLRKEEVAQIMSQKFEIPEVEFTQLAEEGYLYPDTYLIPRQASSGAIISLLKNTFYQKYDKDLQAKATKKGLTEKEVVTLASLVEREAFETDIQGVANVLYKRLKIDMPLQVDATVQYALGYQVQEKRWWKRSTTFEDLEIDSPYNTYKNKGLPPGPISSPGIDALKAVVNADESTPYTFYIHDKNGAIHYARTLDEHNANIKKYLE